MGFNPLASDCWAEFFRDRFGQEPPPLPSELEDTISSDEYSNISGTISVANGGTGTHKNTSDKRSFERFRLLLNPALNL